MLAQCGWLLFLLIERLKSAAADNLELSARGFRPSVAFELLDRAVCSTWNYLREFYLARIGRIPVHNLEENVCLKTPRLLAPPPISWAALQFLLEL